MINNNKSLAFTLAEVLLAMTLIGAIALMTLPTLSNQFKKNEYSTKLKKFVSKMDNAIEQMEIDKGSTKNMKKPSSVTAAFDWYMENIDPYMGHQFVDKTNNAVYYKDGSMLVFHYIGGCVDVYYDVNGMKKPNITAQDRFYFSLCYDDSQRVLYCPTKDVFFCSYSYTVGVSKTVTRATLINKCKSTASTCSRLLELDGWEFKKDYPHKLR